MERITGIYMIRNIRNNKIYVGQSINVYKRFRTHKNLLNKGKHHNQYLSHAWNLYGEHSFEFSIIETCDKELLNKREQFWISELNCMAPYGYNLTIGGDGVAGHLSVDGFISTSCKEVVCLNTGERYASINAAGSLTGAHPVSISHCCRGNASYAGKANGEPLVWAWGTSLDEYNNNVEDLYQSKLQQALRIINGQHTLERCHKSVVCLNTGRVYYSIKEASIDTGCNINGIHRSIVIDGASCGRDKHGNRMYWREYTDYNEMSNEDIKNVLSRKPRTRSKPVTCLNTRKSYASAKDAELELGVPSTSINGCCRHETYSCRSRKDKQLYCFVFSDEYERMTDIDINNAISESKFRAGRSGERAPNQVPVLCVTTGEQFSQAKIAGEKYGVCPSTITSVCRGKAKHAGKHPITKELLTWKYVVPTDIKNIGT